MVALKLTNIKNFMNTLLRTECFDHFLLQEASIHSGATFEIDGRMPRDFYTSEEAEELGIMGYPCLPFSMLRNNCFEMIKGKKTPAAFAFVFLLSPENLAKTLERMDTNFTVNDVTALFLNIRYQSGILSLTTGVSYKTFVLDKSLEKEWDTMVQKFLAQHEIDFEEM